MKELSERQIAARRAFVFLSRRMNEISDGDQRLLRLLNLSVSRVLLRYVDRSEPNVSAGLVVTRHVLAIYHVRDWLKASLVNDVPWLRNLDDKERPKKLMKCRDLEDLVREADKDMRKQNAAIARKPLSAGEEALEFECADGWSIVRLLAPSALDRESSFMQHCIGNGAYDVRVGSEGFRYLSLRDPAGKPHGTMELFEDRLIQFQGKQNVSPLEKYLRIALPFFRQRRIQCTYANCGLVTDEAGETYLVHELPEQIVVWGDHLVLRSSPERKVTLPKVIHMNGSLSLVGVFENIPDRIVVSGDFWIERLAQDGSTGGETGETSFDTLPPKIHVSRNMHMRHIPVTELPSDMRVEGHLDVAGTGITALPKGLRCGSLDICYTEVKEFDTMHFTSEKLKAPFRKLEARYSKLERIVGDARFSKLDLTASKLAKLPECLHVEGDLNIDRTLVTVLPDDMTVRGSLRADKCDITCLPTTLNVSGYAIFDETVVRLPEKFRMPGTLSVRWGEVETMAEDIEAENIILIQSKLPGLPARIRTGHLHLDGTSVRRIDGDVEVQKLDVGEDFEHLGVDVRVLERIEVHCRERKKGSSYCIAKMNEIDARAMLQDKGKLDFRGIDEVPVDPRWKAEFLKMFDDVFDSEQKLGAAA
ncbi:PcfJ domain-containing protein [Agrobacterium salinitolerans]|nr:PcfJ domain-containing protein [Agrobacterium salinitolerans]